MRGKSRGHFLVIGISEVSDSQFRLLGRPILMGTSRPLTIFFGLDVRPAAIWWS